MEFDDANSVIPHILCVYQQFKSSQIRFALWVKFLADNILKINIFRFQDKTGFDISWKFSPVETICMKCQFLFSGGIRKMPSICRLLN